MKAIACFFVVMAILNISLGTPRNWLDRKWIEWKVKYGKHYSSSEEEAERRVIWEESLDLVQSHNNLPGVSFRLTMNHFADTRPEKRLKILAPNRYIREENSILEPQQFAPANFDWREKGVVTAVKNQGMTGFVEAFAAAECVESFHAIHGGHLFNLSVAEVAQCCSVMETQLPLPIVDDVFGCIHGIGGLCKASTYKTGGKCNNQTCTAVAQVTGTKHVPAGREDLLQPAVLEVPLFVTVDASLKSFELYKSGIYDDPRCTGQLLDHVLVLVGYGVDTSGKEYWICRNSWGEDWGMAGYINIQRGKNRCGIASASKYPY